MTDLEKHPTPPASTGGFATPPAIEVRAVERVFGKRRKQVVALAAVDLTVAAGEFVSLIGPSGCGKSTLLRLVADLDTPTAGDVAVFGKPARQARADQDYGIAFQQAGLLPWRTVAANVGLPLELHGASGSERKARVAELLELVGLADFARSRPDQLSGGMQQRVAIARALAERPRLLLMDEPFGALDEITRERMQNELVRICRETGAAVLFVTHSIPEAVFLSDRVVVMSARPGRIVDIVDVPGSSHHRTDDVRDDAGFFHAVATVRGHLHGAPTDAAPGSDTR
ncbi:ABC transporter ATP-binding protein [Nocardioides sp.]|uniref:ABC transporter ATP-binding protein n=1 Tax=Nocardioides sp. TaxID=35761 RepID=UPI002720EA01|nr:ABC transporter ATP-binding protein [Nocardioides sp.]MDO9457907.1 ABC transporter ATP-binding protein [Nocardioides sp.]